jgi:hypothetical protein
MDILRDRRFCIATQFKLSRIVLHTWKQVWQTALFRCGATAPYPSLALHYVHSAFWPVTSVAGLHGHPYSCGR